MTKIWSHARSPRVDWKIRRRPSWSQYASAFSPPFVSMRRLRRCLSSGRSKPGRAAVAGAVVDAAVARGAVEHPAARAAAAATRSAAGPAAARDAVDASPSGVSE